ncbi:CHASE2 domain-containing protein [Candidatus Peregrinibacteria bacterium]|nr:MAG: CHASE2 domain-containing protein [Candidatus Peregrinibacteria bacterium]
MNTHVSHYPVDGDFLTLEPSGSVPVVRQVDESRGAQRSLMNINYFAGPGSYTTLSFWDVYQGKLVDTHGQPVSLSGKIALIGPTAIDLQDTYLSPVSEGAQMAGVEIHANAVQTLIEGRFLRNQSSTSLWILLIATLLINGLLFGLLRARYATPLFLVELIAWLIAGIAAYESGLLLNVVYPIFALILSFTGTFLVRYVLEAKDRRFLERAFGHYLNPTMVEQIIKNPSLLNLGGEKRMVTVFFSDVEHFTSISERMPPEALMSFLNEYLAAMSDVILKYNGTLDKYEGDAIMAFWNALIEQKDHAKLACLAALENQKILSQLGEKWAAKGYPALHVRIGLNTGDVIVGNVGSKDHINYTVMGDAVNLGSRLEGVNKVYSTRIMISESTYDHVKQDLVCREVDRIRVKGKHEAVRIFELIGVKEEVSSTQIELIKRFEEGLEHYRTRNFLAAIDLFRSLERIRLPFYSLRAANNSKTIHPLPTGTAYGS